MKYENKILLSILAFFVILISFTSVYGEVNSLTTDKTSYFKGDKIIFSGSVDPNDTGKQVNLQITDSQGSYVGIFNSISDAKGSFIIIVDSNSSQLQNKFTLKGLYHAIAFVSARTTNTAVSFNVSPEPQSTRPNFGITGKSSNNSTLVTTPKPTSTAQSSIMSLQQQTKITSGGTINVRFYTDPSMPNVGGPTDLKISFINKNSNSVQRHIDYKISISQNSNSIFSIPVTHTAEGMANIPFQFQNAGSYQVIVGVEGILFQPIPTETAIFSVIVGGSIPATTPVPQTNNVQFDLIAPDGNSLSGVILTQNEYQQFVVTKDPRTILSNVHTTSSPVSLYLSDAVRFQNEHMQGTNANPNPIDIQPDQVNQQQKQEEDKQAQLKLQQQKLHDQKVEDKIKTIISSRDEFYNDKDDVHNLIFRANAFMFASRYVDAFNYFDKALSKDPKNNDALDGKNKAYDQIHQLVSNMIDIDENSANNNNPDSMSSKGLLLAQLQSFDDSLSICSSALQLSPENYNAMACKLDALSKLGRYDSMNELLQNSPSSFSGLQVNYRILTLYHLEKYDELESYIDTISNVALSGNSYDSFYGSSLHESAAMGFLAFKAVAAEKAGKTDLANSYYSIIIPTIGQDTNLVKGKLFFLLQDYDKAIFYLEKAPQDTQNIGYLKVIIYDEIARNSAAYKVQNALEHVQTDESKHKFCFLFWCF